MSAITLKQLGREGSLPRRLHFGCGDKHLAGWLNVDGVDGVITKQLRYQSRDAVGRGAP